MLRATHPRHPALHVMRALTVVTALASTLACRQIFGVSKFHADTQALDSGAGETGRAPPLVAFHDDRCTSCMTARCEAEMKACRDERTCKDFWTCRARCAPGDDTCQNTCRARAWPWNGGAYRVDQTGELEACLAKNCRGTCDESHVFGTQACTACMALQCDDVNLQADTADVDTQHLESCDARCVAITQSDERRLAYCDCPTETGASPEAVARWNARRACSTVTCNMECSVQPDLDCMGTSTFVSPVERPIKYRLVAYGTSKESIDVSTASACTLTEPDCKNTNAGPYPLTFVPEHHSMDAGTAASQQDSAGSASFDLKFRASFEPFADHMEVRIGDYRNLLYEVPLLQQDDLTVWWPVATRDAIVQKLQPFQRDVATQSGSFVIVIVADCQGRALPGAQISAESTAMDSGAVNALEPHYPLGDNQTGSIGLAFFYGVPPSTVKVTATYKGQFHSTGQALVVSDGSTLIGLGPSAPPPGVSP